MDPRAQADRRTRTDDNGEIARISVVLPVYNGLPYLQHAIGSILSQSIPFELVISDDVSRDGSADFLRSLDDPRIRILLNTTNLGIFGNLNRCLAAARGDVVQIFSQDDLMREGYLASQLGFLDRHPDAGLVYGVPDTIDADGRIVPSREDLGTPERIDRATYLWIASHFGALPSSISSVMFRRQLLDSIGAFDPAYRVAGDLEFYNRVSERSALLFNRERLHAVRSHTGMTSQHATSGQRYLEEEIALEAWFRDRWSADEFRRIRRFRALTRGRYHLGWIRRLVAQREFGMAARALVQLNRLYPLPWAVGSYLVRSPRPTVPPPEPRS